MLLKIFVLPALYDFSKDDIASGKDDNRDDDTEGGGGGGGGGQLGKLLLTDDIWKMRSMSDTWDAVFSVVTFIRKKMMMTRRGGKKLTHENQEISSHTMLGGIF